MSEQLEKFDLNFNLLFAILAKNDLEDYVCVDFSRINYIPGIVGVYLDNEGYLVYEVNEDGYTCNTSCNLDEHNACIEVLSRVGILFE